MWNDSLQADYEALLAGTAIAPLDSHFAISVAGEDRHAFLHSFCTADVKKLTAGQCCEAFVLNGKGKTMAFVHVLAFADALWIIGADRANATVLIEHLDRYIFREDVQLANLTDDVQMFFAPGEQSAGAVSLAESLPNTCTWPEGLDLVRAAVIEIADFGAWFGVKNEDAEEFIAKMNLLCVTVASPVSLHSIRIERGTPWSGAEADESNLPQELQRDEKSISFTKGCYLGQETVARLDALGRVNQLLVRVQFGAEPTHAPTAGTKLKAEEKVVGRVTSVAWSPASDRWIGLAFVRRAQSAAETVLQIADAETAKVIV